MATHDLDSCVEALLERAHKELQRLRGAPAPTEMVGGWAKLGNLVDDTLRDLFVLACAERGVDPATVFRRGAADGAWSWERATAGQILRPLPSVLAGPALRSPCARVLAADLASHGGVLVRLAPLRNQIVHERTEVSLETRRATLEALAALLAAALDAR